MRATFNVMLRMVIMLALPLAIVMNWPLVRNQGILWGGRAGALLLVAAFVWKYTRRHYIDTLKKSHRHQPLVELRPKLAYELLREAGHDPVNRTQATLFAMALRTPTRLRQRVVEEYEPGQRTLRQKVTIDIQVPRVFLDEGAEHAADGVLSETFPFPLITCPKSTLYDNLDVRDSSGNSLSTLTYREYLSLVANVLHYLLLGAYTGSPATDQHTYQVEIDALMEIVARRNDDRMDEDEVQRLNSATKDVIDDLLSLPGVPQPRLKTAADLVRMLATHYAIVVPIRVPRNGRTSISYKRTIIPVCCWVSGRRVERLLTNGRDLLRNLLGSRPTDVILALENAGTSNSFHVRVQAAEGLYLSSQALVPEKFADRPRASTSPRAPYHFDPHFRFRSRLGQSYAHFYGRHFPRPRDPSEIPALNFHFHEVPPGSDFQATAAAASAAFLIGLMGFALSHAHPGPDGKVSLGSDAAPVLLLAFPGVAASWLGLDKTMTPLFNGSLSARLSLLGTVVFSVVASALYIINAAGIEPRVFDSTLSDHISLLGITKDGWVLLAALAVCNTIGITYRCAIRAMRFIHLSQRNPSE